jgi:uncharacterized membrane protein YqgA involved in biofilm formation
MIPINAKVYWLLWLIIYVAVVTIAHRNRRRTGLTDQDIIVSAGFSLGGVFALLKVLVTLFNDHDELVKKLDWDGITALTISCLLGIVIAIKEIRKLL